MDSDRVLFVIDVSGSMTVRDPVTDPAEEEDASKDRGKTVIVKKDKPKAAPKSKEPPPSRERMFRVKTELVRLIAGLQPSTQFGILCFSHEIHYVWGDARSLRPATPESKAAATAWVKALKADGATRTDKALEEALAIPEVDTVFLLTDGAPKDEKDQRMPIEPILARAKQMNRFLRARIHTISFQQIKDTRMRTFVRDLSIQNDGGEPTLLP
jgi:hypothetical protein